MLSSLRSRLASRRSRRRMPADPVAERAVDRATSRPAALPTLLDLSEGPDPDADSAWRGIVRRRVIVVLAMLALWSAGIQARLVHLQVFEHERYLAKAERQHQGVVTLPGTRGDIVDRNGHLLAYSVDTPGIVAYPVLIDDAAETVSQLCGALGDCTKAERERFLQKFATDEQYMMIRRPRSVMPDQVARVEALEFAGVRAQTESRRWYPNREVAAHLLGFVGNEDTGLGGVEAAFDTEIRGREGKLIVQKDGGQQFMSARVGQAPTAGVTLELTVDRYLQHLAERELAVAVRENRAAGGTVIIQDPVTGEVLAMANEPTFNPNDFGVFPQEYLEEPGRSGRVRTWIHLQDHHGRGGHRGRCGARLGRHQHESGLHHHSRSRPAHL